ncbi:MAG: helix-turn-helix domain-containing protein [Planctomycetaceae bacterium]|nr:helix-turn-helix domain-containing protein [Planctomycetaceae bacterium]
MIDRTDFVIEGESQDAVRRLLTIKEVAQLLGCSEANIYALKTAGELPFVQVGIRKGYRIDSRDLDAFIERRKTTSEVPSPRKVPVPRLKHIRLSSSSHGGAFDDL